MQARKSNKSRTTILLPRLTWPMSRCTSLSAPLRTYPLMFTEDTKKDEFRPVALLGLKVGENLFVGANGK